MIARRFQNILNFRYHRCWLAIVLLMVHSTVKANTHLIRDILTPKLNACK